jgi:hypothetical protein
MWREDCDALDNTSFKQVFRAVVLLYKEWGVFGQALVAVDSTKVTAVNSKRRNLTPAKLTEPLQRIATHIEQYWHDLEAADAAEPERQTTSAEQLREKIRQLCERTDRYEGLRRELERTGQRQVSLTDPDSRAMPKSPKVDGGYNAHVAVDATHKLFVAQEVTNAVTAGAQLSGIALQAKEALVAEQIAVVADMGSYNGEDIQTCEEAGIAPSVARPLTSANRT